MLSSIGIEESHEIIKNKYYEKQKLSWRTFSSLHIIKQTDISRNESIILPKQYTKHTPFLSPLVFLLTNEDFGHINKKTRDEIINARKNAVENFISQKIQNNIERKSNLKPALEAIDNINIEEELNSLIAELSKTEKEINSYTKKSSELFTKIQDSQEKLAECSLLKKRYENLESQYHSDIKRLTFIVEGENSLENIPQNETCPFCESSIKHIENKKYKESASGELIHIISHLEGLNYTKENLNIEINEINDKINLLEKEKSDISNHIYKSLSPKAKSIKECITRYKKQQQLLDEWNFINSESKQLQEDLKLLDSNNDNDEFFKPKDHLGETFVDDINKNIDSIFRECKFPNLETIVFSDKDFDVSINAEKKSVLNGNGYCSYINSLVALSLRKYMSENAKYDSGFLVIDTHTLALDEGINTDSVGMRKRLFEYICNHQNYGQIIIMENTEHTPELSKLKNKINVIEFTQNLNNGRYGFLEGVTQGESGNTGGSSGKN